MADVTLNAAVRSNLLAHANTQNLVDRAQNRLSAGLTAGLSGTDEPETDEVTLSPEAQAILSAAEDDAKSGPSAGTPAFLARQALASSTSAVSAEGTEDTEGATDYGNQPFGQVVKQFTPGHLRKAEAEVAETDGTATDPAEDGTAVAADDRTAVVAEASA